MFESNSMETNHLQPIMLIMAIIIISSSNNDCNNGGENAGYRWSSGVRVQDCLELRRP